MPEGRLIKRKITRSRRLNQLPLECRYLMREFILSVDKEGRLDGDPHWIKREFFCGDLDDYTDEQVAGWLKLLHDSKKNGLGLIELYEVDGVQYLWLPGFLGEQSKTWLHGARLREAESSIPPPPTIKERRSLSKTVETKAPEGEALIPTPFEIELQGVIKTLPNWEYQEQEDLAWLRALTEEYQNVTVATLKACRDYFSDKKKVTTGSWKNRIRHWLDKDIEIKKEKEKGHEARKQGSRQFPKAGEYRSPDEIFGKDTA